MGDTLQSADMFKGEVRQKSIKIVNPPGEITSATFQTFTGEGTAQDEAQTATYDTNTISAAIPAGTQEGQFYIEFTYHIGGFTYKTRLYYQVR